MDVDMARLRHPHPGEILKQEFLNAIGMSQNQLAHAIGVPGNRIHAIINGTRSITGDTDLRLCKFFGLSEGYFLRLQNAYDMLEAKRRIAAQLTKIKPYNPGKAA
jgi:addiction module HigA family antidote